MGFAPMSQNEFSNGDFIACVPHQIEADWDEKWGPLLAGFPLNMVYAQTAESDQNKIIGITAGKYNRLMVDLFRSAQCFD